MKRTTLIALFACIASAQSNPPALLQNALQKLPGVKILDASFKNPEGHTVDELKELGYWPHWRSLDLDGDRRPDAVAVVTKQGEFGVLAIHAQTPAKIHWVVPMGREPIQGIAVGRTANTVTPLFCISCDSLNYYRWSGTAYEVDLHVVGEKIRIDAYGTEPQAFALPASTKVVAKLKACTPAKVVGTQGTSRETRWYLVDVAGSKPVRGWVPAKFTTSADSINCAGAE